MSREFKTPSYSSPRSRGRGCLCWDTNKYSKECCDGSLRAQGIGSLYAQGTSIIIRGQVWNQISSEWEDINQFWENT
jgi:hypothetical protein